MKVAVIGDTHLGRTLYGYDLTPSIRSTMYSFFRLCQEHRVRHAVHLGDLFDSPRPHLALEKLAIQWCNEFERAGINLHLLVGNHDVVSKGGINSALAPLKAIDYEFVRVHEEPCRVLSDASGWHLVFLPFPSPALVESPSEALKAIYAAVGSVEETEQAIVFSHLNVEGAKMGGQDWIYRGGDYTIPSEFAHEDRVALVVSGHIHKRQEGSGRHLILGAAQRLRFDETETPTFAVIEAPVGMQGVELYETGHAVSLVTWEVDASAWGNGGEAPGGDEVMTAAPDVEGAIVKVQPFVDEQSAIDWGRVERILYDDGAEFVKVLSPIQAKREEKQQPKTKVIGEPVKAAAFFIRQKVTEQPERKALLRTFKRVQEETDADS